MPRVDGLGLVLRDGTHLGDERGLAEALFEDPGRVEEFVVDDGVVHAHASFIEDAEDGLAVLELRGEPDAEARGLRG